MVTRVLAFIPARGGSKRVPRKNALPLAGRPLLGWTVDAATRAGVFTRAVVSTDDSEIIDIARASGAEIDARAASLATDSVRNFEVLSEYLNRDNHYSDFDAVCLLPPTSPLRTAGDIKAAYTLWRQAPEESVISVSRYDYPPEFAAELDATGGLHLRNPEVYDRAAKADLLPNSVHPNGAIYLASTRRFMEAGTFLARPMRGFLMPPERSINIDYPHHFACAEALLKESSSRVR
jgi:CMP-N,N'-diacetyllegionaminic acid synthase